MGDVVHISERLKADSPHAYGEACCMQCDAQWVAVAPVGVQQLECPQCRTMKGLFKFPFAPADGLCVWTCDNCDKQLFYLTQEGFMCTNCGVGRQYHQLFEALP